MPATGSSASARRTAATPSPAQFEALTPRLVGRRSVPLHGRLLPMVDPAAAARRRPLADVPRPGREPARRVDARLYSAIEIACLDLDRQGARPPGLRSARRRVPATTSPSRPICSTSTPAAAAKAATCARTSTARRSDPEALVRQARQMMATYGFKDDQAQGAASSSPTRRFETMRGALPGARSGRAAAHRSELRVVGRDARVDVGLALARGAGRRRLPRGSDRGPRRHGRRAARACSPRGSKTPLASNVAVTSFADLPQAVGERRRADRPLRSALLGRRRARFSTSRALARRSASACRCTRTAISACR